jgi:putative transposase
VYYALNRAVARLPLFETNADFEAFMRVLALALDKYPVPILAFVVLPNHRHFVLWSANDHPLTDFCRWLTHTHCMRWHVHYHTSGTGPVYQGRFKACSVETDEHLYAVCRNVERHPLRANLNHRARFCDTAPPGSTRRLASI